MCRRNLFYAGILIAFGSGLLLSLFIESSLVRFVLGVGTITAGLFMLKRC